MKTELDIINERFNAALRMQMNGRLPRGYMYSLGYPNEILQSAGIQYLPIELHSDRLEIKAKQDNHPFDLSNVVNLPQAIQNPIAIFDSKTQKDSKVILTELSYGENNFVVAIKTVNKLVSGERRMEASSIRSLYPKDCQQVIKWMNQGELMKWVNKKKATEFLNIHQSNSGDDTQVLSSSRVAKIILNFENPKFSEKKQKKIVPRCRRGHKF